MSKTNRLCVGCNTYFTPVDKRKLYCSERCKQLIQKEHAVKLQNLLESGAWDKETQLSIQQGRCFYCSKQIMLEGNLSVIASVEHLTPKSRGGNTVPENLVLACKACNSSKRSMTHDEYIEYLSKTKQSSFPKKVKKPRKRKQSLLHNELSAEIRAQMARMNLKYVELAKESGISRVTIANIANGKSTIVNDNFASLLDTLGLELVIKKK